MSGRCEGAGLRPGWTLAGCTRWRSPYGSPCGVHCASLVSPRRATYFFDSLALTLRASLRLLLPLVADAKEVGKKTGLRRHESSLVGAWARTGTAADVRPALLALRGVLPPAPKRQPRRDDDGGSQKQKRPHPALRATVSQREKGKTLQRYNAVGSELARYPFQSLPKPPFKPLALRERGWGEGGSYFDLPPSKARQAGQTA